MAQPQGGVSVAGEALLSEQGNLLQITNSNRAIIEWQSFSIGAGETTQFIQPSADSAVLNRVVGGELSNLQGALLSNGQVYLVNPQGFIIGKEASFDTAGFIAATLDVLNRDFLDGKEMLFTGDSTASMVNLGKIRAYDGDVVLIAHRIENSGEIEAPEGRVDLASGHEILLKPGDTPLLSIKPDLASLGIDNEGAVTALEASLQADSAQQLAIRQSGPITLTQEGGKIVLRTGSGSLKVEESAVLSAPQGMISIVTDHGLTQVAGSLLATSETGVGGTVHVLGQDVHLLQNATVNVSGPTGGGTALIGGDYQGNNSAVQNAAHVLVAETAVVKADATEKGTGGKVIFWGNESNGFFGHIYAQGGPQGGDGGFVEVSSPINLAYRGVTSALAPYGKTGTLLLDPGNYTIESGSVTSGSFSACSGGSSTYNPAAGANNINVTDLETQLGLCSVTINTSAGSGGSGSITVNAGFTWSQNTTLTLIAQETISIGAGGSLTISNTYNTASNFDAFVATCDGTSSPLSSIIGIPIGNGYSPGVTISTVYGNIKLTGTGGSNSGSNNIGIALHSGTIETTGTGAQAGNISLTGTSGSVNTANNAAIINNGPFSISTVDGNITITANSSPPTCGGSSQGFYITTDAAGNIECTGTGSLTITATGANSTTNGGNDGIHFQGTYQVLSTTSGNLSITGTGNGKNQDGAGNIGIYNTTSISTTSGSLTMIGTGSTVSSPGSTTNLQGILMPNGSNNAPLISAKGGTISITGTAGGGNNDGVASTAALSQTNGNITITGTATGSGTGINIYSALGTPNTITLNGTSGTITLSADTMSIGLVFGGPSGSTLLVQPITPSLSIGIGDNSTGSLKLSNLTLYNLQNQGGTTVMPLIIGRSNGSHTIDIHPAETYYDYGNSLFSSTILRGNDVSVNSAFDASGHSFTVNFGQEGASTFTLSAPLNNPTQTNIVGGSYANTFTLSPNAAQASLTLTGGSSTNTLNGPNVISTWNITGTNKGKLQSTSGPSQLYTFTNMTSLTGGSANDTFVFSAGTTLGGELDGGGGTLNVMDVSAFSSTPTITYATSTSGTASFLGTGFQNIQSVVLPPSPPPPPPPSSTPPPNVLNPAIQNTNSSQSEAISTPSNSSSSPSQQAKYFSGSSTCGK
ncbi:MAG: filamentous hemagglutinin N-terminal domain-containing protein [Verrucomicrobiota bacterium]|nr:filamentous hemagglutinin N-terminal domain-containing protein [Verrucomicrobiota bacterium]